CGRYFAMDRDRRWSRTEKAYRAYVYGEGVKDSCPVSALETAYGRGETDEFVSPAVIVNPEGLPLTTIRSEDSVICFNFRPDRARQITRSLVDEIFTGFNRGPAAPRPHYVAFTEYDRTLPVPVAFPPEYLSGTLGEVVSSRGYPQLRVAETEKYAHVTFFFNGGREQPFPGEQRVLVPSPAVATYDLKPEMSARGVTSAVLTALRSKQFPFIVANFANADMVGHTGKFAAAVKAIEAVDRSVGEISEEAYDRGWRAVICGDHGNAEQMNGPQGSPHTAHTVNPVPFIILTPEPVTLNREGILADIAPTVLELAGIDPSPQMTGRSLILPKVYSCQDGMDI
ncbi:MAG TPA: 2,3-bisphosphoglycerate-independent phosphoglycerate mutase, partial [Firmicutes bacterium]|nr:2,3-bisphosphoglycerate-independent phosphoglycerate mutase [Bacillota bacterium]